MVAMPFDQAGLLSKEIEDLKAQHEEKVQRVEELTAELRRMMHVAIILLVLMSKSTQG